MGLAQNHFSQFPLLKSILLFFMGPADDVKSRGETKGNGNKKDRGAVALLLGHRGVPFEKSLKTTCLAQGTIFL